MFDLLHIGHIKHFEEAKTYGDVLVVSITPDEFVNKGPNRPAFSTSLRLEFLSALESVDYVVANKWPTAEEIIKIGSQTNQEKKLESKTGKPNKAKKTAKTTTKSKKIRKR